MRWVLIASAAVLAGCQYLTPVEHPTALPAPTTTGAPKSQITVVGEQWDICTRKQRKQYPPVLDKPSPDFYAGPWCRVAGDGIAFMWMYARPLYVKETPQGVRGYVNEDATLLVRGLRTTGYEPVEVGDKDNDVSYLARRPTSPNVVGIHVWGVNPPPSGQAGGGDNPLRLIVTVRKAGPHETAQPSP